MYASHVTLTTHTALSYQQQCVPCRTGMSPAPSASTCSLHERSQAVAQAALPRQHQQRIELRICTAKTCKRQGSQQVLKFATDLGMEELKVEESGCLGNCGSGPNAILLPSETILAHMATPADVAEVLQTFCSIEVPESLLKCTQLRLAGNSLAMEGRLQQAVDVYSQAIALQPPRGLHLVYSNRSAAHLQLGSKQEALQDAQQAVQSGPPSFVNGWVRLIDAHYALGQFKQAADVYKTALDKCPTFKSTPECKTIAKALRMAHQVIS